MICTPPQWLLPIDSGTDRHGRFAHFQQWEARIVAAEGSLGAFAQGFTRFGFNEHADGTITYSEWCPGATAVSLIGDFSWAAIICDGTMTTAGRWLGARRNTRLQRPVWRVVAAAGSRGRQARP